MKLTPEQLVKIATPAPYFIACAIMVAAFTGSKR